MEVKFNIIIGFHVGYETLSNIIQFTKYDTELHNGEFKLCFQPAQRGNH